MIRAEEIEKKISGEKIFGGHFPGKKFQTAPPQEKLFLASSSGGKIPVKKFLGSSQIINGQLLKYAYDRMVGQSGTPNPLPSGHLPSAIKWESYLIHHTFAVHIGCTLCYILWKLVKVKLRHWTFQIFTLVHLIPHLIDHPVIWEF